MVEGKCTCYVCGRNQNRIVSLFSATNLTAVATAVLALLTIVLLVVNWQWLSTARDQLDASIAPSLDMTLVTTGFKIDNAGAVNICDIKGYAVLYITSPINNIQTRYKSKLVFEHTKLKSGESTVIPSSVVLNAVTQSVEMAEDSPSSILTVVMQYRRSVDKRRFIHVEPFGIAQRSLDKISFTNIAPICRSDTFSLRSEGSYNQRILKKILDTEKLYFRSD